MGEQAADDSESEADRNSAETSSKKPVPATLMEFLKGHSPASAYVSELEKGAIAIPDETARAAAVDAVTSDPDLIPRVIMLTRSALGKGRGDSRIRSAFSSFASNVIRGQGEDLADWGTVGGLSPESGLVKLAKGVRQTRPQATRGKDKDAQQRAEQLLLLGMAILSGRHDFDPVSALSQVYAQLTRNRDTSRRPPDAVVRDAVSSASVKNLETFGAFNFVLSNGLEETRTELSRARDDLAMERDRVRKLQEKVAEAERVVKALQAEKLELAEKLSNAGTQLRGVEGGRDDELNSLRARFRQLLKGKLSPFVSNAQEALGVEPPVVPVAQDRLSRIKKEIEGELDWLNRFLA